MLLRVPRSLERGAHATGTAVLAATDNDPVTGAVVCAAGLPEVEVDNTVP